MSAATITPRQPGHADKASTPPGVPVRVQVGRRLVDYTYAKANPAYATPVYVWDVLIDGHRVETFALRREAVAAARDIAPWDLP